MIKKKYVGLLQYHKEVIEYNERLYREYESIIEEMFNLDKGFTKYKQMVEGNRK